VSAETWDGWTDAWTVCSRSATGATGRRRERAMAAVAPRSSRRRSQASLCVRDAIAEASGSVAAAVASGASPSVRGRRTPTSATAATADRSSGAPRAASSDPASDAPPTVVTCAPRARRDRPRPARSVANTVHRRRAGRRVRSAPAATTAVSCRADHAGQPPVHTCKVSALRACFVSDSMRCSVHTIALRSSRCSVKRCSPRPDHAP
jgi:hypothetical protein